MMEKLCFTAAYFTDKVAALQNFEQIDAFIYIKRNIAHLFVCECVCVRSTPTRDWRTSFSLLSYLTVRSLNNNTEEHNDQKHRSQFRPPCRWSNGKKKTSGAVHVCWTHLCLFLLWLPCCCLMVCFPFGDTSSWKLWGESWTEGRVDGEAATVKVPDRFYTCGHSAAGPDVKHSDGCSQRAAAPVSR